MFHELHHRIRHIGTSNKRAHMQHRPVTTTGGANGQPGTVAVGPPVGTGGVTGSAASPEAPMSMPMAMVNVYPAPGGDYVTVAYQDLPPIFTADGAAIPSTSPGRWGQLWAAGTPREGAQKRRSTTTRKA